jgi:hypothetical protein
VIADAEVTGDPEAMRMTLAAGLARVSALADGARVPSAKASLQKAAAEVEARAQEWRRRFPSPVERLEQLEREQHNIAEAIRESAQFAARMYGLRRPVDGPALRPVPEVAPQSSRIIEGRAWEDILAGRNPVRSRR